MIPPHLQSIFKSLSWCSVSDDWLPSFLPWKHRDSPPKSSSAPPPRAMMKWWLILQLDKQRPWFSVGLISWICRSHTNTQKVGFFGAAFFLTGENAKQPHGIPFCKASACEDWALIVDPRCPSEMLKEKKAGLTPERGTRWCCELHHDMFKARVSTISTRYSTAPSRNRHQNNNKYVKVSGIFLCKLLG